jgi:hypothetical protein
MKIKSAKSFRQWYKNLIPARKKHPEDWNENFMGTLHEDESGFLQMYHGGREDIYGFLRKEVEMAEDGQAIYEFVQNAADSDSTKFYMFYDQNYLIVINNGSVFSKEGVKSILDIGQSFGKQNSEKIGRYGIGFKLVHRLVGKSSGLDELLNVDEQGYRGPILFSWSNKSQLDNFLIEQSDELEYVDIDDVNAPWLLKILITNFPAQPTEQVKDINYNDIVPFQTEELICFQTFWNSYMDKIELNSLDSGTAFFLKLGDKKFDYLEKQKLEYLNGLSTSMHFLKSLDKLVINEKVIEKDKEATNVLEFIIPNGSNDFNEIGLTEVRDKESDAKFKICFADNSNSAMEIKKHPNIYKYFPAVKEVNYLSFVIHSNLFELSSNRQNLTETPINKNLLKLLSKQLINKMEICKAENRSTFKNLFTSILMSEESPNNSSGNGWQSEYFYNIMLEYIQKAIPTKNGFSDNAQQVKINKLNPKLNIDLADFGLNDIQWFEWNNEVDKLLIDEAIKSEKLGIEEWDIRDIIENANLESINEWIANRDENTYEAFLAELEKIYLRDETKKKLYEIKLFKFSDHKFYSINDAWAAENVRETYQERTYNQYKKAYETINKTRVVQKRILSQKIIFNTDKTINISNELQNLGFAVSLNNITTYKNILSALSEIFPKEKDIFKTISEKCKFNTLKAEEKKNLFLNFTNETTKFDNVAEGTLKDLHLFCDSNSEIKPLNRLIDYKLNTAIWLNAYKIKSEEYFAELKPYLVSEQEDIFKEIYLPKQDIILSELTEANEIKSLIKLYQDNKRQFFKEFIIKKTEHSFGIVKKINNTYQVQSADQEAIKFLDANCANNLFVLAQDFLSYKDEDGIVKADDLHSLILNFVNADDYKDILVDVVRYKAKYQFLQKLSSFKFNPNQTYSKEDYEFKIIDLACGEFFTSNNSNQQNDFRIFRSKLIIETKERSFKYSEIPPIADKIKIATKEFSLSKILPSTYQNSNLISDLITQFVKLGIPSEKLNALFGVNDETDIAEIFKKFSEQTPVLQNAEQFFFLIYYHKDNPRVDLSKLGFDIKCAVYPSDYALESEKLPKYLQEWIERGEINISSLESIGIYTENSTLVALRKFFITKSDFNINTIAQDEKLSNGKMLLNTFELLKEREIELSTENDLAVFKEIVRVINSSRTKGQELIIQEEFDFEILGSKSTEWKSIGDFSIYLYNGSLPKIVKLAEIQDYIFYRYTDGDYAVNGMNIYINENEDKTKTLQKVALESNNNFTSEDSKDMELSEIKAELDKLKQQVKPTPQEPDSFIDEVNEFIADLERTEWNDYVPELQNLLQDFINQTIEKQKLFNLIAKIKLTKEKNVKYEDSEDGFNVVQIGSEKYFVHSARGAFAYVHPSELLKMKKYGYKMALDYGKRFKTYDKAEEILKLNSNHIITYKGEKQMEELFSFCEANKDANKHLLIIDKDNASEKSRALLKLLNIEDDYQ